MKTLFPKQAEARDFFCAKQDAGFNTLDTSHVGTGKTVVAAHTAKSLGRSVAVICPKAVIPSWEKELAETGVDAIFVTNYEKLRTGKTEWMSKRGKKLMKWHLPKDTLVLVDEVHKASAGAYTQNAQMLISLVAQGYKVHGMSATASKTPVEMRALGYALGLHSLNKPQGRLKSWYGWMMANGCKQDHWGQWMLTRRAHLNDIREIMYSTNVKRLTVDDFPESFKENRVFLTPVSHASAAKIARAYTKEGITAEIVEQYIRTGTVEDSEWVLVNLLRARQLAESLKAKEMADIAADHVEQGHSVVLFVNFSETVSTLQSLLGCRAIQGGQSAEERQDIIDSFQRDEEHTIVVNIAAGGTGISLHDVVGNRQRISLISPTFNDKDHQQALGRIHRNGAKSDAIQKIMVATGSIEEQVIEAIEDKIKCQETLHGT